MVQLLAALCVLLAVTLVLVVLFDEGSESGVRTCDRLQRRLAAGRITPDEYRERVGTVAADEARRAPLNIPGV
ncbi:MAG: DUF1707 domain-containing protein [Actinoplanes sp.]